jgi:hypothetical protein
MDFFDSKTKTRYILRPVWNPVPYIIDELVEITWSMKSAVDLYAKFTKASANITKKWHNAFKVKVFKY